MKLTPRWSRWLTLNYVPSDSTGSGVTSLTPHGGAHFDLFLAYSSKVLTGRMSVASEKDLLQKKILPVSCIPSCSQPTTVLAWGMRAISTDIRTNNEEVWVCNHFPNVCSFVLIIQHRRCHSICTVIGILCQVRLGDIKLLVWYHTASKVQAEIWTQVILKSKFIMIFTILEILLPARRTEGRICLNRPADYLSLCTR